MSDDDDGDDDEGSQQTPQTTTEDPEHDDDVVDELAAAASSSPRPILKKVHTHAYLVVICFHALNERAKNVLFPLFSLSLSLFSLSCLFSLV